MPWFKVDDGFHSHPKVLAVGNAASGLWARCGSYCSQHITDGFIPAVVAKAYGTRTEIAKLVQAGMWDVVDGGYRMHDFHDYNPTAEKVRADRADAADRQREWRAKRDAARLSQRESQRDNTVSHGVSHTTPTRPDPTPSKTLTQHGSLGAPPTNGKTIEKTVSDLAARFRAIGENTHP